ncbi:hypothetical protein RIF29_30804 [Crotalaria pallida]|uniref:Fe2OG dioxygenase domain-containing protein n=1 Tax=Crotalaria pallida TaxID=3830 RepID=A0AAN9EIX1_CROPI
MASIGASLLSAAPFVLHGGKTNPRNFQRLPTSFRPVKASLKGNAVATKPLVLTEEPPKSQGLPNVQEMVKNNPSLVPEGYIRSPEEMEIDKTMHHLSSQVPVIDFALLKNGSTEELSKLDFACKEWGYFQLVNHGLDHLMQRMKDKTAGFFNLPLEEKEKYAMQEDMQGYGHVQQPSEEVKLDWSDSLVLFTHPARYRNPSVWPRTPRGLRHMIEEYSSEVSQVGVDLLSYFSVNLGMQKDVLFQLHEELVSFLVVNYYPPCGKPQQVLGMNHHTDTNSLTLVMQDEDDVSELEIYYDGGWVPVTPLPNALIVNVGDLIEIWSNGKYKSAIHRAVTNDSKVRTVHITGLIPARDVHVEPLNHLVRAKNPKLYQKVKVDDYAHIYSSKKLDGRTHIDDVTIEE